MQTGALVQRGRLNPNTGNQPYFEKINQKFKAPKSEFKLEAFLNELTPRNHVKKSSVIDFIKKKIDHFRSLNRNEDAAAWEFWHSELLLKSFDNNVDKQFTIDFQHWLIGHGKEEHHQKSPWYRTRCKDKECEAYLRSLFDAKYEFINGIQMLVVKARLTGLTGINEFYLYFKVSPPKLFVN
jgi:hypothetical protein